MDIKVSIVDQREAITAMEIYETGFVSARRMCVHNKYIYIYMYAFSRRFYPKRLKVHSAYTFFISMCVPLELNPQPFALLTQCPTTEPQVQ